MRQLQAAQAAPSGGGATGPQGEDYVLYQALYLYKSDDPEDLTFDANDILQVTDEGDPPGTGWMEGRTQDGARTMPTPFPCPRLCPACLCTSPFLSPLPPPLVPSPHVHNF